MFDSRVTAREHLCDGCRSQGPCDQRASTPLTLECWECGGAKDPDPKCENCHGDGQVVDNRCPSTVPEEAWEVCTAVSLVQGGMDPWGVPFLRLPNAVRVPFHLVAGRLARYRRRDADPEQRNQLPSLPASMRGDARDVFRRRSMPGAHYPEAKP